MAVAATAGACGCGMGVAALSRPDGFDADGLPFPTGHKQMEQGGAPVVFRGEPLRDYETVVRLIAGTTTAKGLTVTCRLDRRRYLPGRKVTQEEMATINIKPSRFHGEWNYVIRPHTREKL